MSRTHIKPIAVAVDSGSDYAEYRRAFSEPVFDIVEAALRGLG